MQLSSAAVPDKVGSYLITKYEFNSLKVQSSFSSMSLGFYPKKGIWLAIIEL